MYEIDSRLRSGCTNFLKILVHMGTYEIIVSHDGLDRSRNRIDEQEERIVFESYSMLSSSNKFLIEFLQYINNMLLSERMLTLKH